MGKNKIIFLLLVLSFIGFVIISILLINIRRKKLHISTTSVFLLLLFLFFLFLGLLIYGLYSNKGLLFDIGQLIATVSILFVIIRVIMLSKK